MIAPPVFDIPTVRHPLRWATVALLIVGALIAGAGRAAAHAEHGALPEGFEARVAGVHDGQGATVTPDGLTVAIAQDGTLVTVTWEGPGELVVFGEQASEPLLRMTGGAAEVNAASPQAVQVRGAQVDPDAAAELIDLVWARAPERWVALGEAGSVAFMDHRAVPGHAPVRRDFATGDVAAQWQIAMSVDGVPHTVEGTVVAVDVGSATPTVVVVTGSVLFALLALGFLVRGWRSVAARLRPAPSPSADPRARELVSTR